MSDNMRWRYGDTSPVVLAVDSATVIEIGDLVYLDTDDAKPASAQADQLSEADNQSLFVSKFAGVAMQRSRSGDTTPIRVATTGVFEFDCTAATFEVGNLIGPHEATSGTELDEPGRRQSGHHRHRHRPLREAQPDQHHAECWSKSSAPSSKAASCRPA